MPSIAKRLNGDRLFLVCCGQAGVASIVHRRRIELLPLLSKLLRKIGDGSGVAVTGKRRPRTGVNNFRILYLPVVLAQVLTWWSAAQFPKLK